MKRLAVVLFVSVVTMLTVLAAAGCGGATTASTSTSIKSAVQGASAEPPETVEKQATAEPETTVANQTGAPGSVPKPCSLFTESLVQTVFPDPIPQNSDAEDCRYTNGEETRLAPKELASIDFAISKVSPVLEQTISAWEAEEAEPPSGHDAYVERVSDLGDSAVCHYDHYKTVHQTTAIVRRGDLMFVVQLEAFHDDGGCPTLIALAREINSELS